MTNSYMQRRMRRRCAPARGDALIACVQAGWAAVSPAGTIRSSQAKSPAKAGSR